MHKFRIQMTGTKSGKVYMDDAEVFGLRAVDFRASTDDICTVTLTFNATDVEVETDGAELVRKEC